MSSRFGCLVVATAALVVAAGAAAAGDGAGERIYRHGSGTAGTWLSATVAGDVPISGIDAACATCHRRSGMGSSEGVVVAPSITGAALFGSAAGAWAAPPARRGRTAATPLYTAETLARAIREGIAADGRRLGPTMPRYDLTSDDMDALIAYLRRLGAEPPPGVTKDTVHLATVVSDGVAAADRTALTAVVERFVADRTAHTRNEERRRDRGSWTRWVHQGSYRDLVLHVWTLHGAPSTWAAQLDEAYRREPVFALVSGVVDGPWRPVHEFCQANQVPCLFPHTDLPVLEEGEDVETVYFSRGPVAEAEAIARHVLAARAGASLDVVQVYRPGTAVAEAGAAALRRALAEADGVRVVDVPVADVPETVAGADRPVLVAWTDRSDLERLGAVKPVPGRTYLSATMLGDGASALPAAWRGAALVARPWELPSNLATRLERTLLWLRARQLPDGDLRLRTDAFFAVAVTAEALVETKAYLSRDYLMEKIEHMVDSTLVPTVYPQLSLGPGQRFASRGCFLTRVNEDGRLEAVTDWVTH